MHKENILINTVNFYYNQFKNLTGYQKQLFDNLIFDDLLAAKYAVENKNFNQAIEHLIAVYEIAAEHGLIDESRIQYPGPGDFGLLVR